MKSTRRALILSALSLVLCVSMLLGTTYAWFTDSVVSGRNIVKAGNLDIAMYYADGTKPVPAADSSDWKDASNVAIFDYALWEPGYTAVRHIKIANVGALALKYQLDIVTDGVPGSLADVLDVYAISTATRIADRSALSDTYKVGTLKQVLTGTSLDLTGNLMPKGSKDADGNDATSETTLTIAVKMRENAGSEYRGLSIANGFAVVVRAAQYTFEKDAFDDQYDKDATYPEVDIPTTVTVDPTLSPAEQQSTLSNTLASAQAGKTVNVVLPAGDFMVTNISAKGKVNIVGTDEKDENGLYKTKVNIKDASGNYMQIGGEKVTFEKVTLVGRATDANPSASVACGYNVVNGEANYKDCVFQGSVTFAVNPGNVVNIENCRFTQANAGVYSFWTYGAGTINVIGCEFEAMDKAVKIYSDGTADTQVLTVNFTDCVFKCGKEGNKPAIAVATNGCTMNINCTNCTCDTGTYLFCATGNDSDMYAFFGNGLVGAEIKQEKDKGRTDLVNVTVQ